MDPMAALTLKEAAAILTSIGPPITETQLRAITAALRWKPAGWRSNGNGRGHPYATYTYTDLTRLHAAITPWLPSGD